MSKNREEGQSETMWEGNTSTLKSKKCVKKVSRKKKTEIMDITVKLNFRDYEASID